MDGSRAPVYLLNSTWFSEYYETKNSELTVRVSKSVAHFETDFQTHLLH